MSQVSTEFIPTRIAILTVSNRRGEEDDTSSHYLRDSAQEAGHHVVDKAIVKENRYAIRAEVSAWIASDDRCMPVRMIFGSINACPFELLKRCNFFVYNYSCPCLLYTSRCV